MGEVPAMGTRGDDGDNERWEAGVGVLCTPLLPIRGEDGVGVSLLDGGGLDEGGLLWEGMVASRALSPARVSATVLAYLLTPLCRAMIACLCEVRFRLGNILMKRLKLKSDQTDDEA